MSERPPTLESPPGPPARSYRFGDFELCPHTRQLLRRGRPAAIQPKPFDLLLFLILHRGEVVPRDRLLDEVWPEARVNPQALGFALHAARKAVDDDGERQSVIRTVPRAGLQFVAPLEEVAAAIGSESGARSRARDPRFPFLGRERLIAQARSLLDDAATGKGSLLLVAGGPGLGKSRLLQELADVARVAGGVAVQGHCSEIGGAPPYWAWVQALRGLRQVLPGAVDPELWEEVFPQSPAREPGAATREREGSAARFRWFDTIGEVLRRATRERPCAILLDDVHRADLPSIRLLTYLSEELGQLRLLVVATHREFELLGDPERSATFSRLARSVRTQSLRLEGLSREEVTELARCAVGGDADFARRLHEHTAGNPFFVKQLLALASPSGAGPMQLPHELPPTVRAAVVRHLDSLPGETRRLLGIAAVLGREFDVDLLVRTSGTPESRALARLAPAVAADVLGAPRPGGLYRFRHILVRDALYEEWPDDGRARWHLRAAEALGRRHGIEAGGHAAALAAHFLEAVPIGTAAQAIQSALTAGRWAREQLAFEESAAQLERAFTLDARHGVLEPAERCDLLIELGAAHNACGSRPAARRALDEAAATARRLGDGRRLALAALGASPGLFAIETGVEDQPLIGMLEAALSLCPSAEIALRAQLLCRLAMALYWSADAGRRFELADQACALAQRAGDPRVAAYASLTRFAVYWSADNLEERAEEADRIVEKAEASGDLELSLMARVFRISTLLDQGDVTRYAREVRSLQRIIETGRYPQAGWYPILYEATLALLRGRLPELENRVQQFASVGQRFSDVNAAASMAVHLVLLNLLRDRLLDAVSMVSAAADGPHAVPAHHAALALCAARAGQRVEALSEVRQLCAGNFAAIPCDLFWLFAMTVLAEAVALLGDQEQGRICYSALSPYRGRHATIGYGVALWGPVDRALGLLAMLLGDYDQAEVHLHDALAMCDRIGAQTLSVGTRLNLAELLDARRGSGDATRKREIAEGALREAIDLDLVFCVRRLQKLL